MSIKTRRFLFYSFVLIFLLLGTFLVLGSRGYHFDWRSFTFDATGSIYISSTPTKAKIQLGEKSIRNESGILQRGTLIDNLLPDTYEVALNMPGYSSWSKQAPVVSGSVTVFDSIILVPDGEPLAIATSTAREMEAAGRHLALESGGEVLLNDAPVLGHEIISLSQSGTLLTRSTVTGNFYLANAFEPDENLNVTLTFNNLKENVLDLPGAVDIQKILPYPYNDRRFVVSTERAIYLLDTQRLTIEQIALGPNDFYIQNQNTIAWVNDDQIVTFNLPLRTQNVAVDLAQLDITPRGKIQSTTKGWLLIDSSERLLLQSGSGYEVIDRSVRDFTLSPNEELVATIHTNGSLWVYDLLLSKIAEVTLPTGASDYKWFKNSFHMLVLAGDTLLFTEVGDILPLNQVTLGRGVYAFAYAPGADTVEFSTPSGIFQKTIIE